MHVFFFFFLSDDRRRSGWWFGPSLAHLSSYQWYLLILGILLLLLVAFLTPYLVALVCRPFKYTDRRHSHRWIRLSNLKHSRAAAVRKSVELGGTLLATVTASGNRRDDASSGYSSIAERLSLQQEVAEEENQEADSSDDSADNSETQVYAPVV